MVILDGKQRITKEKQGLNYTDIIPWLISLAMLIVALITLIKNTGHERKKEERNEELTLSSIREGLLKANLKLDQVCTTTNETRSDIKSVKNDITDLDRRVVTLETQIHTLDEKTKEMEK